MRFKDYIKENNVIDASDRFAKKKEDDKKPKFLNVHKFATDMVANQNKIADFKKDVADKIEKINKDANNALKHLKLQMAALLKEVDKDVPLLNVLIWAYKDQNPKEKKIATDIISKNLDLLKHVAQQQLDDLQAIYDSSFEDWDLPLDALTKYTHLHDEIVASRYRIDVLDKFA